MEKCAMGALESGKYSIFLRSIEIYFSYKYLTLLRKSNRKKLSEKSWALIKGVWKIPQMKLWKERKVLQRFKIDRETKCK